jgi:hypothetical protein
MQYSKEDSGVSGNITLTTSEGAVTGDFCKIQCITIATFTTLTDNVEVAGGASKLVSYPAGFELRGKFSTINVATGTIRVTVSQTPS